MRQLASESAERIARNILIDALINDSILISLLNKKIECCHELNPELARKYKVKKLIAEIKIITKVNQMSIQNVFANKF